MQIPDKSGPRALVKYSTRLNLQTFGLALGLIFYGSASFAQEPESPSEDPADEPAEAKGMSDEEAGVADEAPPEEARADEAPEAEEPTEEPPQASEPDAIAPIDEDAPSLAAPAEEEPDYFGTYEPLAPTLRLNEDYEPPKPKYTGPFRAGQFRVGLSIGAQATTTEAWLVPGFSLGYFLVNGLEVHVDTDFWLIGDPFIMTPSPGLRYVFWMVPKVHPYIGTFYRHYFVGSGHDDADSVGGRAGVYFMTGRNSYFGGGVVYEHILQDHLFVEQDLIYPEIVFAFAF